MDPALAANFLHDCAHLCKAKFVSDICILRASSKFMNILCSNFLFLLSMICISQT
uniref:Uncharacterized protein n=1 Tax=Arundo donax TaxID=35708 RepID=A0A0A8ZEN1_ARUDO